MAYRMLALDMDGTLLNSEKAVSPTTWEALIALEKTGVHLALCTGRNPVEALYSLKGSCGPIHYGSLISGALAYDFTEKRAIAKHTIAPDIACQIIQAADDEQAMTDILATDACICRKWECDHMDLFHMGIYQEMYEDICIFEDDLQGYVRSHPDSIAKVNVYHRTPESRSRTRARIEALPLELADAEATSLECSGQGISKAKGLSALCSYLGITMDEVVAIGDAPNDLVALEAVGCAVAMGNAFPVVKEHADLVVADNDHDGIVEAIGKLF